jgi:hypothetical protein
VGRNDVARTTCRDSGGNAAAGAPKSGGDIDQYAFM